MKYIGCIVGLVLLFSTMLVAQATAQDCVEPPEGLVSWWPGDGNAEDIAGGHDGSILGGMGFAPGMVGQAFDLDNVDDGVEVPNAGGVFDLLDEWTLDAWVFPNAPGFDQRNDPIVWKTSTGGNRDTFALGWHVDSCFHTGLERASDDRDFGSGPCSLLHIPARWYHVAGVYDGTDLIVYVDGVEDARMTIGSVVAYTSSAPLRIGNIIGSGHGNSGVFDGLIDEVEIYDRSLSAAEIQVMSDAGSAGKCKQAFDKDGDGIRDLTDNCPFTPNPLQDDSDGDSAGDACDNCLLPNSDQRDDDENGLGDTCDGWLDFLVDEGFIKRPDVSLDRRVYP